MNTNNHNNYCVILAGGKGRRLWPCSREKQPKQFLDFFSTGRTLLQSTFDRITKIIPPERVLVSTNMEYHHLVQEQLPELPEVNILPEPIYRNTAPSVAWACHWVYVKDPDANLLVVPSDQAVFKEEAFQQNMLKGLELVEQFDHLLTMGVKPSRPEPGYGYVQLGDQTDQDDVWRVKSFTEKPDREFAKMFMESGEFLWNTGIFLSNIRYLRSCMFKVLPVVIRGLEENGHSYTPEEERAFIQKSFPSYPNLSIDYGILEKNENVYVMKCDFGWADLGMWHSIYESWAKGEGDNVVIDSKVMLDDCSGNIIKLPADHVGVINGLENYIVAEKDNVLLICRKEDSSALVRKYISEVQIRFGDEFI